MKNSIRELREIVAKYKDAKLCNDIDNWIDENIEQLRKKFIYQSILKI